MTAIDESGGFDPRSFLPAQIQDIEWREKGSGRLIIPHRLCEFLNHATNTRNELLVLTCLVRFSLGFHRDWCEAGYSFISRWTGISDVANVRKSIRKLLELGVIRKTEQHNCASNSGSIYEIPVVQAYLSYLAAIKSGTDESNEVKVVADTAKKRQDPGVNLPSEFADQRAFHSQPSGRVDRGPEVETTTKKESTKENLNITLSSRMSANLASYLEQIGAPTKRESEEFFLCKLLKHYDHAQLEASLSYVLEVGTLGAREKCHSPLKYLATAMDQILPKAMERIRDRELANCTKSQAIAVPNASEEIASRPSVKDHEAFERQLSEDEKMQFVALVTAENSYSDFVPPANVLRSLAVAKWLNISGTED